MNSCRNDSQRPSVGTLRLLPLHLTLPSPHRERPGCRAGLLLMSPESSSLSALTWQAPLGLGIASSYFSFPCPVASSTGVWITCPHPRPLAAASCLPSAGVLQAGEWPQVCLLPYNLTLVSLSLLPHPFLFGPSTHSPQ